MVSRSRAAGVDAAASARRGNCAGAFLGCSDDASPTERDAVPELSFAANETAALLVQLAPPASPEVREPTLLVERLGP